MVSLLTFMHGSFRCRQQQDKEANDNQGSWMPPKMARLWSLHDGPARHKESTTVAPNPRRARERKHEMRWNQHS